MIEKACKFPGKVTRFKRFSLIQSWDYDINSICAKANKVLGLIKRTFGVSNKTGIKSAFKELAIPILDYARPSLESLSGEAGTPKQSKQFREERPD